MDVSVLLSSPATWIAVASTSFLFVWRYVTSTHRYFADQGIPGPKPLPLFGNVWGIWKENLPQYDKDLVKKYGKVFGYYDGLLPNLWITDADLIKSIFVKDFDHFVNRRDFTFTSKVVRKMVSLIRGQEWKDIRSSITPTFTTGKIKLMSVMIKECADRLNEKFGEIAQETGKIDAKQQFSAFTMDVIARCAFGMTIDNLGAENDPFMKNAKTVFSPPANKSPLVLSFFLFPKMLGGVAERIFFTKEFQFFIDILENLIKERRSTSEKYNDFIEVATESISDYKKEVGGKSLPMWNQEEVDEIVIAQSTLFLLAGFDTTASTLTSTIFQLAKNPDVQDKLYDEIMSRMEKFDEVSHEMILDFPYVDHIIHETLRMYPPVPRVERECNQDVTYNGIHIKKGTLVTVPAFALHYDEDYYPEPDRYNPDRWSAENKANINPYAWLPFGMGPRNCVGMRFALEEMKIALCSLVKQFRFYPVEETTDKLQFEDGFLTVAQPTHAIVGLEKRD